MVYVYGGQIAFMLKLLVDIQTQNLCMWHHRGPVLYPGSRRAFSPNTHPVKMELTSACRTLEI